MTLSIDDKTEWLEADGLGGFASGTTSGVRTRRYHALLLTATTPPTGRVVLVNGFDAWVDTPAGSFALTTQRYAPDVHHPDGSSRIVSFASEPWPNWELAVPGGVRILYEIFVEHGTGKTQLAWTLIAAESSVVLRVRPFLSGRDYHSLQHENGAFRFEADVRDAMVTFRPYDGLPSAVSFTNGTYRHAPDWYRSFLYDAERERGLDALEDLAAPGEFSWSLAAAGDRAVWQLCALSTPLNETRSAAEVLAGHDTIRAAESKRRAAFATPLDRAADAYLVERGLGRTIVAGYPWFTDWGRDTFIAVRGLCLATGRLTEARDILVEWAGAVSEGMLPNRFPDHGESPEFNSVDASLWYVIAAGELLDKARRRPKILSRPDRAALETAIAAIVAGYHAGTRFGIRMDDDGLLAAGVAGVQLTWMDARVGDRVITPRIGKPVEIQALWLNALNIASRLDSRWRELLMRGLSGFARFWIESEGYLADVVDVDHVAGTRDVSFRPNQILAAGGLPLPLITGDRARRVVAAVERRPSHAAWPSLSRPGRARIRAAVRRRLVGARRCLPSGHGLAMVARRVRRCVARYARPDSGSANRSAPAVRRPAPGAPPGRGAGPRIRDCRRRRAVYATRLPVSGVVARRADSAGTRHPCSGETQAPAAGI
jgi:predicted glycogen debranching enzyme